MIKYCFLFVLIVVSFACSEEKRQPKPEIYQIREIGELSTTEFVFSKVLRVDDTAEWYKFGDRKILISCKAKVKAGIDLKTIPKGDISVKGNSIDILLPNPRITSFNMDPNSVKVEMLDVDGLRFRFSQTEINSVLQMGEKSIRNSLSDTGIYKEAEKNAISFVKEFYQQLGFEEVNVTIKEQNEK